jgi:hypothetical protein
MQVVEDRGIILAAAAHSGRNTIVGGKRVTAHIASAWRVRKECRSQGYSNLLRVFSGPACAWFGVVNYWYMRLGNAGATGWLKAMRPDLREQAEQQGGELPGMGVAVHHFLARSFRDSAAGIRAAKRSDTQRCIALINRTHRGQDFFRPYSAEFLWQRLDDPFWGPKPVFWAKVYTWDDYFVLEEDGKIVACAGLWDRGQNVREVWRHKSRTAQERRDADSMRGPGASDSRTAQERRDADSMRGPGASDSRTAQERRDADSMRLPGASDSRPAQERRDADSMRLPGVSDTTGEERTVETAALMDFGYAQGREDAMARLLAYLIGRTQELGRQSLMAPIEQLPALVDATAALEPALEERRMGVDQPFPDDGVDLKVNVTRPYTDLAYW